MVAMSVLNSDSPVTFTPSSAPAVSPGALVFYDVVNPDVVSRCSVLSCIAEAGGEGKLPDAVTLSDFRTWMTAAPWQPCGKKGNVLSLHTICIAAKVGSGPDCSRHQI